MYKPSIGTILFWVIMCFLLVVMMSGCHQPVASQPVNPPSATMQLYNSVKSSNWLVTISILGIAISAAALINGSKAAYGPLIGSGIALVTTLMVARYSSVLAFVGLGMAVVVFAYSVWRNWRSFREVVRSVEVVKPELMAGDRVAAEELKELFDVIQSPITRKRVSKAQNEITERNSLGL